MSLNEVASVEIQYRYVGCYNINLIKSNWWFYNVYTSLMRSHFPLPFVFLVTKNSIVSLF